MAEMAYQKRNAPSTREAVSQQRGGRVLEDNRPAYKQLKQKPSGEPLQRVKEEEELLQKKSAQPNRTGLPDHLKTGIESLSGLSMDPVKVHYNSSQPAQLNALAYAQGTDIHLAPGQENHLPHEAWHVVQQARGRVKPTMQMKEGVPVNDDKGLEQEADVMGAKALGATQFVGRKNVGKLDLTPAVPAIQRKPKLMQVIWDTTHLVREMDGSIFGQGDFEQGEIGAAGELSAGQNLFIDDEDIFFSRRGANQENPERRKQDEVSEPNTPWYRVLQANFKNVEHENVYVRAETIAIENRRQGISIEEVMEFKNLKWFIWAQDRFQSGLQTMDELQSAGYEFEFASFKQSPQDDYTKEEIIPSHELMAKASLEGNFFKLSWQLESDSENTLELVTPPFVFPKTPKGTDFVDVIEKDIGKAAGDIVRSLNQNTTLPWVAEQLEKSELGKRWKVEQKYQNYGVVKKVKSGGDVYGQKNVSMYPEEIGALLIERFTPYTKGFGHHSPLEPEGMAILINQELTRRYEEQMEKTKVSTSEAVNKAIAIFARYCSNATAIPSMRMRQKTRQRHDTMPTTIKESLGVWIKTDALNLLKPILSNPADNDNFKAALTAAKDNILIYFNTFEQRTIQNVTPPPTFAPDTNKITLLKANKHLMNESYPLTW